MMVDQRDEALHATFLTQDLFERHVIGDPRVRETPTLRAKAERIARLMDELYRALDRVGRGAA
jgi:hypothetical protein